MIDRQQKTVFEASGWAKDSSGLSLVELMIVMALSLVLMASVYLIFQTQQVVGRGQEETITVQQDLRAIIDIMAWDLRQAGCDPTMRSTAGLVSPPSGPNAIMISMDLNDDGDTGDLSPDEQVTYSVSGSSLLRNGELMVQNVTTFGLVYRDVNNATIHPTGGGGTFLTSDEQEDVRSVSIRIAVQSDKRDPSTNEFVSRTLERRVLMKNLGL